MQFGGTPTATTLHQLANRFVSKRPADMVPLHIRQGNASIKQGIEHDRTWLHLETRAHGVPLVRVDFPAQTSSYLKRFGLLYRERRMQCTHPCPKRIDEREPVCSLGEHQMNVVGMAGSIRQQSAKQTSSGTVFFDGLVTTSHHDA